MFRRRFDAKAIENFQITREYYRGLSLNLREKVWRMSALLENCWYPRSVMTEGLHEIWEGELGMTCLCRGWWEHRPPEWWWSQTTLLAHRTIRRPPRRGPSRASWSSPGTPHGPTQCCPTPHPLDCTGRKGGSSLYNTLVLHNATTSKHRQASSKVIAKNVSML